MGTFRQTVTAVLGEADADGCRCTTTFEGDRLVVDASSCDGGRLATDEACRATVIDALTERDVGAVRVTSDGIARVYETDAAALLVATGRFVESIRQHEERLADRARRDPLGAAREATGRAGRVARVAAETGLAELAARAESYDDALAPLVGLTISDWRVDTSPPSAGELTAHRELSTGDTVRHYEVDGAGKYVLTPLSATLSPADARLVTTAYQRLADGLVTGGERAPSRAVQQVAAERDTDPPDASLGELTTVLERHTRGHGLLEALFADAVSDVFVTAPAPANPLRVSVGDRTFPTNVRLTERGADALAARYRRESGRGFSRANPTLDAAATIGDNRIRVAGVTAPVSDGVAFAFRAHDRTVWTLPALVANETLTVRAAALLSLAVERGAAILVAGPRGAGKTTLLGALLPELRPTVRTIVIEDTPELPVTELQTHGRDVQALTASGEASELDATEAVRTALRLGDGALVVGEIRGEEAQSLYEAMRVGAHSEAVLGTIHGDGALAVYDRVVDDLGVPPSSFGVTDAIVTLEQTADGTRRVRTIEEVDGEQSPAFHPLFERTDDGLVATGRLDRGNARLLSTLAQPEETYADVRSLLTERQATLTERIQEGRTSVEAVGAAAAGSSR